MWLALALAATYQQCAVSSACTIGEFLYDDAYQPQLGAVCTLTAKYPDGSDFLTASASATADAWYYYDAAIGTTTGLYPANLCCTSGNDYLCIDKSFEVTSASAALTAGDVWNYSSRSLTSFGSLAADIWNNSTRSLTTFGDLVTNVWNYSATTTTTPTVITSIMTEQTEQRELLEKLVNAPIVSFSLDENQILPDLNSKLDQSRTEANALQELIENAKQNINNRSAMAALFNQSTAVTYLVSAWESPAISQLNETVAAVRRSLTLESLENAETALAEVSEFLDKVAGRNLALEAEQQQLASLIQSLPEQPTAALAKNAAAAKTRILALNQYPGGETVITPVKTSPDKKLNLKNLLFNLQGLLGLNQQILAAAAGEPIRSLWFEEGSIIFKGIITNPSPVISQTVPLKFYLPRELKSENIISLDPSLAAEYDPTEEAFYVAGKFTLPPEGTKFVYVEVEDIWQLTESELDSFRNQAAELVQPLTKTSYFAQGTVLKTQIDTSLGKISLNFNKAIAPENRIRAYREAQLELAGVNTNLARLQDLVAQALGTGSIFGFIGGVQAVAVWGILIIVIASFVFLTIYMRQLKPASTPTPPRLRRAMPAFWANPAAIPILILVTAITTAIITQLVLRPKTPNIPAITETKTPPIPSPSAPAKPTEVQVRQEKQVLGEDNARQLNVPVNGSVNIRSGPGINYSIIMTVKSSVPIFVFEEQKNWLRFDFVPTDNNQDFWVSRELVD